MFTNANPPPVVGVDSPTVGVDSPTVGVDSPTVGQPAGALPATVCHVRLMGDLGNRLFQLATAQAHCWRTGCQLALHADGERLSFADTLLPRVAASLAATAGAVQTTATAAAVGWSEPSFAYTAIPAAARSLCGFFQSGRYFEDSAAAIREWFTPSAALVARVEAQYAPVVVDRSVAVHVRRGDYVAGGSVTANHDVVTLGYHECALTELRQRLPAGAQFYVFSDDVAWCRAQSVWSAPDCHFVDARSTDEAFYLLTRFRHYVLSNSSFSWWASYLGEPSQLVVAPQRWFTRASPHYDAIEDVFEAHWLRRDPAPPPVGGGTTPTSVVVPQDGAATERVVTPATAAESVVPQDGAAAAESVVPQDGAAAADSVVPQYGAAAAESVVPQDGAAADESVVPQDGATAAESVVPPATADESVGPQDGVVTESVIVPQDGAAAAAERDVAPKEGGVDSADSAAAAAAAAADHTYDRWQVAAMAARVQLHGAWKVDGAVTYMLEHLSVAAGARYLERLLAEFVSEYGGSGATTVSLGVLQAVCAANDGRGEPKVHTWSVANGAITLASSTTSLRYAYHALRLLALVRPTQVCEVGAGYGGLALVLLALARHLGCPLSSYRIYDLDGPRALQRAYLRGHTGDTVVTWGDADTYGADWPLPTTPPSGATAADPVLLSTYAISELPPAVCDAYLAQLVPRCTGGAFLAWNVAERSGHLPRSRCEEDEDPQTGRCNRLVWWLPERGEATVPPPPESSTPTTQVERGGPPTPHWSEGLAACYYINLDRRGDRRSDLEYELRQWGVPERLWRRVPGVLAEFGALGCSRAHCLALEAAVRDHPGRPILVLEDDFQLLQPEAPSAHDDWLAALLQPPPAAAAAGAVDTVVDPAPPFVWQVALLAHNIVRTSGVVARVAGADLHRVVDAQTTGGYLVHGDYVPTLLANFRDSAQRLAAAGREEPSLCLDLYWKTLQRGGHWWATRPAVGRQRADFSDIRGHYVDYRC
jgi:hypothetical protein